MTKYKNHIWVIETKEAEDEEFIPHDYAFVRSVAREIKEWYEVDGYKARIRKYVPELRGSQEDW